MNDKKCLRCGADEFRINGYCSVYCEDMHALEQELKVAYGVIDATRKLAADALSNLATSIWFPVIETSPKDVDLLLSFSGIGIVTGSYNSDRKKWYVRLLGEVDGKPDYYATIRLPKE